MKLRMAVNAKADFQSAANWYNKEREGLGDEFLDELFSAISDIEADPLRFARVGIARTKREVRSYSLKRFPYSIIYERVDDGFTVIAVAHAKRRPSYWLRRKND